MQLITTGNGIQPAEWNVRQKESAGFSRVYFIKSGEVTYRDSNTKCTLSPGVLYVFPTHQSYDIFHNPENPIECLWFHIDMFPYSVDSLLKFDFSQGKNCTVNMIIASLDNEYTKSAEADKLYLILAEALMELIVRHPSVRKTDTPLLEILEYIRTNLFSHSLTVKALSKRFGYSAEHFIRLFRTSMNITPYRYITELRIKTAARQICDGHSVSETADYCGYGDIKTFAKAFKKIYGVAPSKYVKFYVQQA